MSEDMNYQANIQWLDGGRILAESGPMRLIIDARLGQMPQRGSCIRAAEEAFRLLESVAHHRLRLSRFYSAIPSDLDNRIVEKMIRSVLAVDENMTPMAAVAGSIADGVAAFLRQRGMTRVIVNNGGDIAIRTSQGESVNVGVRPDLSHDVINHVITLGDERVSWGVATSGLEGRSLTRGVASAATAIAGSASMADAAATSIANASYIEDESVIQKLAGELDAQTDIPGIAVTIQAGPFSDENKELALSRAMMRADALIEKKMIFGAYVVVDGKEAMTDFVRQRLNRIG